MAYISTYVLVISRILSAILLCNDPLTGRYLLDTSFNKPNTKAKWFQIREILIKYSHKD